MLATVITAVWSESLWGLRKTVLATNFEESDRDRRHDKSGCISTTMVSFSTKNCAFGLLHGSNHDGVVRISVGSSYLANELFVIYYYTPGRGKIVPRNVNITLLV